MKVLYRFTHPPYRGSISQETLDIALATAAYDIETGLLFEGEGVLNLLDEQMPKQARLKDFTRLFTGLDLYDIENLWVNRLSLDQYGLSPSHLLRNVTIVDEQEIQQLIREHNQVITL